MIFGRIEKKLDDPMFCSLKEVSFATSSEALRSLSSFLLEKADELDEANSPNWHRHIPSKLCQILGCDVIVMMPQDEVDRQ